jgi:starvation-inducible outer membrane lipoprotein
MKKVLIITIALMLAGCAASAMKTWVGHDEAEVLASWGATKRPSVSGYCDCLDWQT